MFQNAWNLDGFFKFAVVCFLGNSDLKLFDSPQISQSALDFSFEQFLKKFQIGFFFFSY